MKSKYLSLLSLAHAAQGLIRRDLHLRNIAIAQMEGEYAINEAAQEVIFTDRASDFEEAFRCPEYTGKKLTFTEDRVFLACCHPEQFLIGSPETGFDCCNDGEHLGGSAETGFKCCPGGQVYDGDACRVPEPQCTDGKILVNQECVCPSGMIEVLDGSCRLPVPIIKPSCDSEVHEGKCYILKMESGHKLGHNSDGYAPLKDDFGRMFSKFTFCKTSSCDGTSPINPGEEFRVRDIRSQVDNGEAANPWLEDTFEGGYFHMTSDWERAGRFSITKWTEGLYCISHHFGGGVLHNQACFPTELVEVPCDIHAAKNNCLWRKKGGNCGHAQRTLKRAGSESRLVGILTTESVERALRRHGDRFIEHLHGVFEFTVTNDHNRELDEYFDDMCQRFDLEEGIAHHDSQRWTDVGGSFETRLTNMLGVWTNAYEVVGRRALIAYTLFQIAQELRI